MYKIFGVTVSSVFFFFFSHSFPVNLSLRVYSPFIPFLCLDSGLASHLDHIIFLSTLGHHVSKSRKRPTSA